MQLIATAAQHPFRFIEALGVNNPVATLFIPHRDNPPLEILFDSGLGDGRAAEIDPYPKTLDSFRFGGFVPGGYGGGYIVSNWNGAAFAVTKTGGSRFTDFATTSASRAASSATAAFTQADIGQVISAAGLPSGATIASVESATDITLSAAATATAAGLTVTMQGRAAAYAIAPDFGSVELNDLFIAAGVSATPATQAARYALTALALGAVVRQVDTQAYWKVIDITQLAVAAGWSQSGIAENASTDLSLELEIVVSGKRFTSQPVTLTIANDYIRGTEGLPTSANPAYPAPQLVVTACPLITGLTGGGAAKLDGLVTAGGVAPSVIITPNLAGAVVWQLAAGTDATAAGVQRPADYDGATNQRVWKQVL